MAPKSSVRSAVRMEVTPSFLRAVVMRSISLRTIFDWAIWVNTAPSESMTRRSAPTRLTAFSMRASSAPRSYSPPMTVSSVSCGETSTKAHLPAASQASMSQPKPLMLRRMSTGGSSNVTNTPDWPNCSMPDARNWQPNTVLALPAVPDRSDVRCRGRPPLVMLSKPGMPVSSLGRPNATSVMVRFLDVAGGSGSVAAAEQPDRLPDDLAR
jgi:hypothetical protein